MIFFWGGGASKFQNVSVYLGFPGKSSSSPEFESKSAEEWARMILVSLSVALLRAAGQQQEGKLFAESFRDVQILL